VIPDPDRPPTPSELRTRASPTRARSLAIQTSPPTGGSRLTPRAESSSGTASTRRRSLRWTCVVQGVDVCHHRWLARFEAEAGAYELTRGGGRASPAVITVEATIRGLRRALSGVESRAVSSTTDGHAFRATDGRAKPRSRVLLVAGCGARVAACRLTDLHRHASAGMSLPDAIAPACEGAPT
jgi:hypothetical protein